MLTNYSFLLNDNHSIYQFNPLFYGLIFFSYTLCKNGYFVVGNQEINSLLKDIIKIEILRKLKYCGSYYNLNDYLYKLNLLIVITYLPF